MDKAWYCLLCGMLSFVGWMALNANMPVEGTLVYIVARTLWVVLIIIMLYCCSYSLFIAQRIFDEKQKEMEQKYEKDMRSVAGSSGITFFDKLDEKFLATVLFEAQRRNTIFNHLFLTINSLVDICVYLRYAKQIDSDDQAMLRRMLGAIVIQTMLFDPGKDGGLNKDLKEEEVQALFDVVSRLYLKMPNDVNERNWAWKLHRAASRFVSGWRPARGEDADRIATEAMKSIMHNDWIRTATEKNDPTIDGGAGVIGRD